MSNTTTTTMNNGTITHADKLVYGVGFNDLVGVTGTKAYKAWSHMLERCYCPKFAERTDDYAGCTVTEEWLTFSTFYRWYTEAVEALGSTNVQLDKDILFKTNKVYGPELCLLVSKALNVFCIVKAKRTGLPMGVKKATKGQTFEARNSKHYLGSFKTCEEAALAYIRVKRNKFRDLFLAEFEALDAAGLLPEGFTAWGAMKAIADQHWPMPDL